MAERIKLGGLWANKSKDGVDYLTGKLSPTVKILIFKNNYKQPGDNQPTHVMYLAPIDPDPNAQRGAEQGDSFMAGGEVSGSGDDSGDEFTAPARPQAPRPMAPASTPRPMTAQTTNTRPSPTNGAPATPSRRPAPAPQPQSDDIGEFEDPFGE